MTSASSIQQPLTLQVFDGKKRTRITLQPSDFISGGGVGDVYRLRIAGQPNQCIKIYKKARVDAKTKLLAMLQQPPKKLNARVDQLDYVQFAWPTALVEDLQGNCIGFVMPEVDYKNTRSLQPYLVPKSALLKLSPEARSLNGRVKLARNISALMADLHSQGHAFIDFKDQNLRVYPDLSMAAFIDTDGYRIQHANGTIYPGLETTPTFNSPESAKGERATLCQRHDDFVLAVVLFQILNFGIHPFQGVPGNGNTTVTFDLDDNVIKQIYPYGARRQTWLHPSPASIHTTWPTKTLALFEQTFLNTIPGQRVTAADWTRHLDELASQSMVPCAAHPKDIEHVHFRGRPCPRCELLASRSLTSAGGGIASSGSSGNTPTSTGTRTTPVAPFVISQGSSNPANKPSGLPPPIKKGNSTFGWVALVVAIALLLWWATVAFSAGKNEAEPAPVSLPKSKSDDGLTRADYEVATAGFSSLLNKLRLFSQDQNGELQKFANLVSADVSSDEFSKSAQGLFLRPSNIWGWQTNPEAAKAALLDVEAALLHRQTGVTQKVLSLQAAAAELDPTNPVIVTNLAYYILRLDAQDAQALSTLAIHLQAKKGGKIRTHTLEVLAAALLKTQDDNTWAAKQIVLASMLLTTDVTSRCTQMNRYPSLYPGLETAAQPARAKGISILEAAGKPAGACGGS